MRNKKFEARLEICITPKQKEKLKKFADNAEMTVNEFVRDLIRSFLNNEY